MIFLHFIKEFFVLCIFLFGLLTLMSFYGCTQISSRKIAMQPENYRAPEGEAFTIPSKIYNQRFVNNKY